MLQVLELIAGGATQHEALHAIVRRFEELHPGTLCSILMARDGALYTAAAPSLPAEFNAAVDGLPIAEGSAICGTAAARRASVVVADLATDPLAKDFRALATKHQLRSTWSTPVVSANGDVIATFAIYRRDGVPPTAVQHNDVSDSAQLVRIVVEREQALAQRRSSEALLQLAGKVAHLGAWAVEFPSRSVTWSEETARIHKRPFAFRPSLDEGIEFYAPGERAEVRRRFEACATEGTPFDIETLLITEDGSRVHVRVIGRAIRDERGQIVSVQGALQDITERVQAEQERRVLEQRFLRAQRLESIGTLAGGIAHDLNNVLAPMMMSLDLLREQVAPSAKPLVDDLQVNLRRGANLVRQVLTFARGLEGKREPIDVAAMLREQERIIRDTFPKGITLVGIPDDASAMINGDATQIHQVLLNLCVNARDAMPAGGTLTLGLALRDLREPAEADRAGVTPGPYVELSVTDTGEGIPAHLHDIIFEPFYTTKEVGKGTGLGLSTVASIVKSHGGSVHLESEVGRGARFSVLLPVIAKEVSGPPRREIPMRRVPPGKGELVLVVDDEPLIRSVAERVLQRGGYRVLLAEHGHAALALLRTHPAPIAAMICDVSMPVMDGPATVAAVRQLKPNLPIIVSSGFFGDEGASKLLDTGVDQFVSKPFSAEALLTAVRGVIDGR